MINTTVLSVDRSRPLKIAVGLVQVALAVQFIAAGTTKLLGDAQMVTMFDDIGAGQWFRLLVGALEIAGGAGLLAAAVAITRRTQIVALFHAARRMSEGDQHV